MKKYVFFGVAGVFIGFGASFLTPQSSQLSPVRPTTRVEATTPKPTTNNLDVTGIVNLPNITSSEKVSSDDGFPTNVSQTLKYMKVDETKATCLCSEVDYGSTMSTINSLKKILETHDEAYLLIDSPGGSVFDGAMLVSFIEGSKKPIHTVAVGLAASMGAQIFSVGKKRYVTSNAILMWHPAAGGVRGTVPEMESLLGLIKRYTESWDKRTAARAGIPYDKFELMVLKNLWLMADEAVKLHLADEVVYVD